MLLNRTSLLSLLTLLFSYAGAQQFGGNPSRLKWKQINTDTARIIFPEGIEPTANRVAEIVHELQKNQSSTIGGKVRKVNIVLQNQNILSNGYVGLGPWRSEFYLSNPQNSFEQGSLPWADKLALHEYRHVQQYSNFNVGLSKIAGIILGQEGQAFANSGAIPDYFFEGDAVFNETVLSQQGRGRQPIFLNGYASLFRQQKNYSYMKLRNGSYKNYVPDHYQLGYLLVGYGREKYGADFWKKVTQDAARYKPLIYPWQGAVKKYSGLNYKQFVADALAYYSKRWPVKQSSINFITEPTATKTDYKYPAITATGDIIVLKKGYRQVPSFYIISPEGQQKKITTRNIAYNDYFSYNNGMVVLSGLYPDKRWDYREYSDITLLDLNSGKARRVTHKERFFSPDISHSGNRIAVVEMKTNQASNLLVIDLNGQRQFRINGSPGEVFTYPKFSANDSFLYVATRNAKGDMALQQINIANSKRINIVPFGNRVIGLPQVVGDTVFFTSTFKGVDEAWAFVESAGSVYRVADNVEGLYSPTYNANHQLVASFFTADGFRLGSINRQEQSWQKVDFVQDALPDLLIPEALHQQPSSTINNVPERDFAITRYRKSFRLFNFHSWRPYYDQPEFSATLYGQNVLNTFRSELSYTYNTNESSHQAGANFIYGGWYVQPFVSVSKTWDRTINYNRDTTLFYNENNAGLGLSLPLNFSGGKQFRYLMLTSSLRTKQLRLTGLGKQFYRDASFNYMENRLVYTGQVQKAVQHIYPHWAQSLLLQYRNIVNNYTAHQFLTSASIYLPGFKASHSIVVSGSYSARDTLNQYYFSDNFPFSRGYTAVDFPRMWRLGLNYHATLFYPDLGFANLVYFLRVRTNVFYDLTQAKSLRTGNIYRFNGLGAELYFDTKWWNQQEVTFGLRYSRLLNNQYRGVTHANQWEFILPVNLFN